MPGEKNKPQPLETTEVAPKFTLRLTTRIIEREYQDILLVIAEFLKSGEVEESTTFNWDALGNYREDAKEWALHKYVIHTIQASGPIIEEEVTF